MHFLKFAVTIPISVIALLFAASNTTSVEVFLTPFHDAVTVPLYAVGLLALGIGFLGGALLVWFYSYRIRIEKWQETRRANRLEKEIETQKETLNKTDQAQNKTSEIDAIQLRHPPVSMISKSS